jgi:hypothetical protein
MLRFLPGSVLGLALMAFCYYQLAMHLANVLPKSVWAILAGNLLGGLSTWP